MAPRLREMQCEISCFKNADGGCSFSQGSTMVWSSCSGPADIHSSRASEESMVIDVSFRSNSGDNKFHPFNSIISSTLYNVIDVDLFPHTALVVTNHHLQDDGSLSAVALNSTCFALLDNGIPFRSLFCGVNIVRIRDELIVDPTKAQEKKADAQIFIVLIRNKYQKSEIMGMDSLGEMSFENLKDCEDLAKQSADKIFEFYHQVMERKHSLDE